VKYDVDSCDSDRFTFNCTRSDETTLEPLFHRQPTEIATRRPRRG
jgi:hypothetical protein